MHVNVVIVGHVDHGKSTLIGRLLYDSENITEGRVEEIQKLAEEYKRRFEFAYFIDSFDDELKEERTIDTTGVMFKSENNYYSIADVPGHKEFIKNMLTGASRADVAVLVVAADDGVQEQTGRHAFLVHMLGIEQLYVVINKMDAVGYSQEVYDDVRGKVARLLKSLGYEGVTFIPGSAMEGDNIYKHSLQMPWYEGPTLIESLDTVHVMERTGLPRFVVQDTYTVDSKDVVVGRVESGTLRKGDRLVFQPSNVQSSVRAIRAFEGELPEADRGDSVGIVVEGKVARGDVGGVVESAPAPVTQFLGEAVILEKQLSQGDELELRCGTRRVRAKVRELREKIDSETGEVIEKGPRFIGENEAATIVFETEPLVVERFSEIPELGRFVLVKGRNIGAGVVLEKEVPALDAKS
jgi:small GTP-binding protein